MDIWGTDAFVRVLRRELRLGRRQFNICFVDDGEIERLNLRYLRKARPTDVLAFPWKDSAGDAGHPQARCFKGFLGDILISVPMAQRNARAEGHSTRQEIRWLILHGLLHLLGHDHERDSGEMSRLELALRDRLGGGRRSARAVCRGSMRGVKERS